MTTGTLYGMHGESGNQIVNLVQRARDAGVYYAAVIAVHNPGLCIDVKRIESRTLTIARFKNPNDRWEGGQDVVFWSAQEVLDFASQSLQSALSQMNDEEYQASDYLCPGVNEWDAPEPNGWEKSALAWKALLDEADRLSPAYVSRGLHPIRLAIPGSSQGTPEYAEMVAVKNTGLFTRMKARGDLFMLHEGVFWDEPIDLGFGDLLPGAPFVPPGGGSRCGRFNYWYSLNVGVEFVVTEFYDGRRRDAPTQALQDAHNLERLSRMKWYDRLLRQNPWSRGFCCFELTDDPNSAWRQQAYTLVFQSQAMLDDMVAERDKPNATVPPMIVDTRARGMDVSGLYQKPENMRFGEWRTNQKIVFCFYGAALGVRPTPLARELQAAIRAGGMMSGPYQEFKNENPLAQCDFFLGQRLPGDELPYMLVLGDYPGVTEPMLRVWCDRYDEHNPPEMLWLYSNNPWWKTNVVDLGRQAHYSKYGLVLAGYPNDPVEGQPVPLDAASILRRSTPPFPDPIRVPLPWTEYDSHQYTGKGSLPATLQGYRYLDLQVYKGTEAELRARFTPEEDDMTIEKARQYIANAKAELVKAEAELPLQRVKVIVPAVNIRSGPDTSFPDIGDALRDQIFEVWEIAATGWYRIDAFAQKWITGSAQYVVRL